MEQNIYEVITHVIFNQLQQEMAASVFLTKIRKIKIVLSNMQYKIAMFIKIRYKSLVKCQIQIQIQIHQ